MAEKLTLYLRSVEHECKFKVCLSGTKKASSIVKAFASNYGDSPERLVLVHPRTGEPLGERVRIGDVAVDGDVLEVKVASSLEAPAMASYEKAVSDADRAVADAQSKLEAALAARASYETSVIGASDFEAWMASYTTGPLVHKVAHYFDIYERHFSRFRGKKVVMLEIGVQSGGSIGLWASYFGSDLVYHGVDINPNCRQFEDTTKKHYVHHGDATDATYVKGLAKQIERDHGPIDIILDDGSHESAHMRASFEALYHSVSPTGVYVVEDCMTNYWLPWGGGARRDTFVEFAKRLVDSLNAFNVGDQHEGYTDPTNPPTKFDDLAKMPETQGRDDRALRGLPAPSRRSDRACREKRSRPTTRPS